MCQQVIGDSLYHHFKFFDGVCHIPFFHIYLAQGYPGTHVVRMLFDTVLEHLNGILYHVNLLVFLRKGDIQF
ncbi:hypothetical protein MBAV_000118 [Candidatus Magnetobacterium bavaricum]|uniref:Uncharacterized protein n=1 Tax=Candidatus Magnetobacterium bavaricum TaxID=29290 RepID=A0A0F3H0M5_9BACT|nr:hypothetical protein MBAV_000118 [Candidatus Magnetobacterium bavaricum]